MPAQTILYGIAAVMIALFLAFFQYGLKNAKGRFVQQLPFMILRFISWLSVLLLLINPQFKQQTYTIEKPTLVVAVDNSSSVMTLEDSTQLVEHIERLKNDESLTERFDLQWYTFGNTLNASDSVSFTETQTNISEALQSLNDVYKNSTAPTLLLTDGNQTLGTDYQYISGAYKNPVFPLIIGDTIAYTDLMIRQLNANRYAYLKNSFPVEVILAYDGDEPVNSTFSISAGNRVLHTEALSFSAEENSRIITVELPANKTGVQTMIARIAPLEGEKNTTNNTQPFAVEVIDEKATIAIVSSVVHPDIGALKELIEHNEQWEATVGTPAEINARSDDFQLFILYQPNPSFSELINTITLQNKNTFTVTGLHTDWPFLNRTQEDFRKSSMNTAEDVLPEYHPNYLMFLTEDIGFSSFPPLKTLLGNVNFTVPSDVLLHQKIGNVVTEYPLLATFEDEGRRGAVLFGQDIWKWRMENFRKAKNFEDFDTFFGKLIQYLISDQQRDRLNIFFESFYYGNSNVKITAEFFDRNYVFTPKATLEITVRDKISGAVRTIPMLLKNRNYEADLSALPASDYAFTVTETEENIAKSGNFRIIEFDVEKQFLNADVKRLRQLAAATGGTPFFTDNQEALIQSLVSDERFVPIQKSEENIVPLIAWKYLLIIIILSLSAEWFLRKYNGLI